MKFWPKFRNAVAKPSEPADSQPLPGVTTTYETNRSPKTPRLSETNAQSVSTAWRCVNLLTDIFASAEKRIVERGGNFPVAVDSHPLNELLAQPSRYRDGFNWWSAFFHRLFASGNSYALVGRYKGVVIDLSLAQPSDLYSSGSSSAAFRCYVEEKGLLSRTDKNFQRDVRPVDLVQIHGPGYNWNPDGFFSQFKNYRDFESPSPVMIGAASSIGLSLTGQTYQTNSLVNGAHVPLVLKQLSPAPLSEYSAMVKEMNRVWSRISEAGTAKVLPANFDLERIGFNAIDVQLLETLRWSALEIARVFGVPSILIDLPLDTTHQTRSLQETWLNFQRTCLTGFKRRIESALEKTLLSDDDRLTMKIQIDLSDLRRGTMVDEVETALTMVQKAGIATVDEVRPLFGLKPLGTPDSTTLRPPTGAPRPMAGNDDQNSSGT